MLSKKKNTLKNWISVNFDLDRKHLSFCHNSRLWCEHLFRPCVTPGWQKGGWAAGDAPPEEIIKVSFVSLLLRCIPEAPAGGRPRDPHSWVPTRNHIHEHTHTHYICLHLFLSMLDKLTHTRFRLMLKVLRKHHQCPPLSHTHTQNKNKIVHSSSSRLSN